MKSGMKYAFAIPGIIIKNTAMIEVEEADARRYMDEHEGDFETLEEAMQDLAKDRFYTDLCNFFFGSPFKMKNAGTGIEVEYTKAETTE
jgi:hypothetical protein